MYEKNLTEDLRLRLSSVDMDFLRSISNQRSISISECIRSIIGEYRRSIETLQAIQQVASLAQQNSFNIVKGEGLSSGDTKTNLNDQLQH